MSLYRSYNMPMYFCYYLFWCHHFFSKLYSYCSTLSWSINVKESKTKEDNKKMRTTWYFFFLFRDSIYFSPTPTLEKCTIFHPIIIIPIMYQNMYILKNLFCLEHVQMGGVKLFPCLLVSRRSSVVLVVSLEHPSFHSLASSLEGVTFLICVFGKWW